MRRLTTGLGTEDFQVPRGRIAQDDGSTREFRSEVVPRYQRRTREVIYTFPKAMWKSLRTTDSIENLNREFQRRTKTQASFSTEEAAVTLLFGLVAFGQIQMRRITGHDHVAALLAPAQESAA